MDNHLINHNLINHNLSKISGNSKEEEDCCSSAIIDKSESIETDLDIRTLEQQNNLKHKMQSFKDTFKPSCPDFEAKDCPISCCVFLCLLAKHNRSKKRKEEKKRKDKKLLKYSTNSIQSNGNTTASTVQEDDLYGKNPTRVSSQTNLNNKGSNENLQVQEQLEESHVGDLLNISSEETAIKLKKNTQV